MGGVFGSGSIADYIQSLERLKGLNSRILLSGHGRLSDTPQDDVRSRVVHGFRLVLGRQPRDAEVIRLTRLYDELLELCKASPAEAAKLAGKSQSVGMSAPEAAAWIALGRALLNLDEMVTRE